MTQRATSTPSVNGPRRQLFPAHRDELRASGLSDATLETAGIYSEADARRVQHVLGWTKPPKRLGAVLVFPYHGLDGGNGYARIKPDRPRLRDGKPVKYESPRGRPNEAYFPAYTATVVDDPRVALLITEGEKKSLCADQHGLPCIGLVGVYGWKTAHQERLLPALERVAWKGRKVFLVFDSDRATKPEVQAAESRLAATLARYGATVRCVRLPDDPSGKKIGLDDFVVQHGVGQLHRLIGEAVEPEPPSPEELKRPARDADPCAEVARLVAAMTTDGVSTLRFWRGTFWRWAKGRYLEAPAGEVRARLVERLNTSTFALTRSIVGDHLMQLEAQTLLTSDLAPPAWLGDAPAPWPADEVLVCRNGLMHLPSYLDGGEYRRPPTPRFFCTAALDFAFDADAPSPRRWLDFLAALWGDDRDSPDVLREWFGYLLTADTSHHKILLMVGPPRSGKGTIARVLRELVGTANVAGPTLSSLATNFGLWPLIGKSLAIISDARLSGRSDLAAITERLLSISGEDALTIDRKNLPPTTCKLPTRFVILTNELPRLNDASGALANRMIVLRLTRSWLGKEDPTLTARLLSELPGILLWSIVGWRRLRQRGRFQEPTASREMRRDLDDLTSPIRAFLQQCCEIGAGQEVIRGELHQAYTRWAEAQGMKHIDDRGAFGRNLRAALPQLGSREGRDASGSLRRWYVGIGLKTLAEREAS